MNEVLTNAEQVTPTWLTDVLRKSGCLPQGHVTKVRQGKEFQTPVSQVVHLEIDYSPNESIAAPSRLFLKMTKPNLQEELVGIGEKEVTFYRTLAARINPSSLVRCFDAVYDEQERQFHLLLEDLSETHTQTEWPIPPIRHHCEIAIDSLANIHASWWNHAQISEEIGPLPSPESVQKGFQWMQKTVPDFLDFLGDRISTERRAIYEQVVVAAPELTNHIIAQKGRTLVHNDSHCWNFLFPHDTDKDTIRIIDWQGWDIGVGTDDLAYMIALHWYPERRGQLEQDLLKRYHSQLLRMVVTSYDWDDCWRDYRLSVVRNISIPMWQWNAKLGPWIWWSHLERAMLAFEDLGCVELLGHG